jgi:hypothetical protein
MQKISKEEIQKRLDQISELFAGIVVHAQHQSQARCPYKNRFNQCTAEFGCRNKRKSATPGERPMCAGDDKLSYRNAWDMGESSAQPGKADIC